MLSKINLKSADLVIWIINKHCLEIPLTGYDLAILLLCTIFTLYALTQHCYNSHINNRASFVASG